MVNCKMRMYEVSLATENSHKLHNNNRKIPTSMAYVAQLKQRKTDTMLVGMEAEQQHDTERARAMSTRKLLLC